MIGQVIVGDSVRQESCHPGGLDARSLLEPARIASGLPLGNAGALSGGARGPYATFAATTVTTHFSPATAVPFVTLTRSPWARAIGAGVATPVGTIAA